MTLICSLCRGLTFRKSEKEIRRFRKVPLLINIIRKLFSYPCLRPLPVPPCVAQTQQWRLIIRERTISERISIVEYIAFNEIVTTSCIPGNLWPYSRKFRLSFGIRQFEIYYQRAHRYRRVALGEIRVFYHRFVTNDGGVVCVCNTNACLVGHARDIDSVRRSYWNWIHTIKTTNKKKVDVLNVFQILKAIHLLQCLEIRWHLTIAYFQLHRVTKLVTDDGIHYRSEIGELYVSDQVVATNDVRYLRF